MPRWAGMAWHGIVKCILHYVMSIDEFGRCIILQCGLVRGSTDYSFSLIGEH